MEHLLGALTVVFALGVVVPQVVVSLIRGHWHGLAFATLANSALSSLAWTGYGVAQRDLWLVVTSVVYLVIHGVLSGVMWDHARREGRFPAGSLVVAVWAGVLASASLGTLWSEAVLVMALTGGVWASCVPQVWAAWRSRATDGVSVVSWLVFTAEAVTWFAYGLVIASMALVAWAASAFVLSVAVLCGVGHSRRRSKLGGNAPVAA